jgi:hypothetical protein
VSVIFFVGRNGFGKTHALCQFGVIPCWEAGRLVVSNITLFPEELGFPEKLYRPLSDWAEIPRLGRHVKRVCRQCGWRVRADVCRRCGGPGVEVPKLHPDGGLWSLTGNEGVGLVLDEVTAVLPARDAVNVPPELQRMLNQFRKPDIAPVLVSAPAFARADLMLREVCMAVVESEPFLPGLFSRKRAAGGSTWREHRAFRRLWYDAYEYEEAETSGRSATLEAQRQKITISPRKRKRANAAYDTLEGVDLMDHIACGVCGGKFRRETCKDPAGHREYLRAERDKAAQAVVPLELLQLAAVDTEEEAADAALLSEVITLVGHGLGGGHVDRTPLRAVHQHDHEREHAR